MMMPWCNCFFRMLTNMLILVSSAAHQLCLVQGQSIDLKTSALITANGSPVCASESPVETLQSKSKLDCIRTCISRKNPLCSGVNFRDEGRQCSLFSGLLRNYERSENCRHFQVPVIAKCPDASSSPVLCMVSNTNWVTPARSLNGWIIIQEAYNLDFEWNRSWADYKAGFGHLGLDYWFGLEKIHQMISASAYKVRFEVRQAPPASQTLLWLEMASFSVDSEMTDYKLAWAGMTGSTEMTSAEPLTYHNGMMFSTYDNNHNVRPLQNCPTEQGGAWWFNDCYMMCPTCLSNKSGCGSRIGFNIAGASVCANFTRVMIQVI